jgi:PhnB protein
MAVMRLTTYVNFAGTCAEAFRYYEQHLGGKITFTMKHGDSPQPSPLGPDWKDAVLHASIELGGTTLLGADIPNAEPMRSAYLTLAPDSDADAERIFEALSDGGRVLMPMGETFFASRFGQVRDRFGLNWMVLRQRQQPAA